jgi:hypothetical protein
MKLQGLLLSESVEIVKETRSDVVLDRSSWEAEFQVSE